MNFKVPLVLNLADYPVVNTQSAEALKILQPISTWYSFSPEANQTFVDNYQQTFGVEPDAEAAYSYDAMRIFLAVMEICHSDIKCIQNELKTHPWQGVVSPSITFDADGNAILPISLIQYDKNKLQWASLSAN